MNTHILVPIKNIENQINNLTNNKIEKEINGVRIAILQNILKGKQISLNEKDTTDILKISLMAVEQAMITMESMKQPMDKTEKLFWTAGHSAGYKQAYKDLL